MPAFGLDATIVGNGVDTERFIGGAHAIDERSANQIGLNGGPVFLAVGGIEERKNTVRILEAFAQVLNIHRHAQLVIAGGALAARPCGLPKAVRRAARRQRRADRAVIRLGPIADADMPSLYRIADALVFPSVKEGFGLVVLEAMASGMPVVDLARSRRSPNICDESDVVWCDPPQCRLDRQRDGASC